MACCQGHLHGLQRSQCVSPAKDLSCSLPRRLVGPITRNNKPRSRQVLQATARQGGPDDAAQPDELRQQIQALERLFHSQASPDTGVGPDSDSEPPGQGQGLANLPLWRVQWTVLPGMQEVLHVHVPHYVHMFETIMAGPRPWRFGHLYLPGGSANLGDPKYSLRPGTSAPLVGTLMEIGRSVRMGDGRILILACGIARFKMVAARQETPFTRADVEALPDEEEVEEWREAGLVAADEAQGRRTAAPLLAAMQAANAASCAAAVAASQVWQEFESEPLRVSYEEAAQQGGTAPDPRATHYNIQVLMNIGTDSVLALPANNVAGCGDVDQRLADVVSSARQAAQSAAAAAAAEVLSQDHKEAPLTLDGIRDGGRDNLNTTSQRGVAARGPEEGLDQAAGTTGAGQSEEQLQGVYQLENLAWQELDAIIELSRKVHNRPVLLPPGLLSLRPPCDDPDDDQGVSPFGEARRPQIASETDAAELSSTTQQQYEGFLPAISQMLGHADRQFPGLRRAQRLSYVMAAVLPDVSRGEGRQGLLEAASTAARLRLVLTALRTNRRVLAALVAVQGLGDS